MLATLQVFFEQVSSFSKKREVLGFVFFIFRIAFLFFNFNNLGFCILNAADAEDKKKFKKEFNLDFNEIDKNGEKIGKLIGMKMAPICPTTIMTLANTQDDKDKSSSTIQVIVGEVIKIEKDFFVSFVVRESNGNSSKLLWTSPIETSIDMANQYLSLQGKSLQFSFENQNIFDPKIGEYRAFKIIKKINSK